MSDNLDTPRRSHEEVCDHHDHMPGPVIDGKRTQLCWMCDTAWCVEGDTAWRTTGRPDPVPHTEPPVATFTHLREAYRRLGWTPRPGFRRLERNSKLLFGANREQAEEAIESMRDLWFWTLAYVLNGH